MQVNDRIKQQLGNWWEVMVPLIESSEWDNLFSQLKAISKAGKVVIPKSDDLFNSLKLVDRHKMKCLVLLQCPYATMKEKVVISNGIPMDCRNIAPYQQPSLHNWWQAIEDSYGFNPDNELRCDLSYLLQEEGVLLLNSSLSVELNKVDSHAQMWEPIMRWFLENVIGTYACGLPIVLVGTQAQRYEKYINPLCHHILKIEHMAAVAYQNRNWSYGNMFKWINEIIRQSNGESEMIQWTRRKGEGKKIIEPWDEPDTSTVKAVRSIDKEWEAANKMPWE